MESWVRLCRLRWLQQALRDPDNHLQALCALFGATPWDPEVPTVKSLGYVGQLKGDLEAAFGVCHLTPEGRIAEESLLQLRGATSVALQAVLRYSSTVDRETTRLIDPRNFPRHVCSQCGAAYDVAAQGAARFCCPRRSERAPGCSP